MHKGKIANQGMFFSISATVYYLDLFLISILIKISASMYLVSVFFMSTLT